MSLSTSSTRSYLLAPVSAYVPDSTETNLKTITTTLTLPSFPKRCSMDIRVTGASSGITNIKLRRQPYRLLAVLHQNLSSEEPDLPIVDFYAGYMFLRDNCSPHS